MKIIFLDIDGVLNTNSDRNISDEKLIFLSELVSKQVQKLYFHHPGETGGIIQN